MNFLRLTFLGTGTSLGVPVIGCDCEVCTSSDPKDKRTRSSVYIQTEDSAWVIDTGTDFRTQCLRENVRRLDAVVFTHAHTDHVMGLDDIRPFCWDLAQIPIYANLETMDALRRIYSFAFSGANQYRGYILPKPVEISAFHSFSIHETVITPFPLVHGKTEVYGYLLERSGKKIFAYMSDCNAVPEASLDLVRGAKHLIIDALRHRDHPTHFTVAGALEVIKQAAPEHAWLTHISHELSHTVTEADLPPNVKMAFDGLQLNETF